MDAPHGTFRPLHVDGLEPLENFEVPTGAFSYHGRLYVFVADEKPPGKGQHMHTSHLAVTHQPGDVEQGFERLYDIASTWHPESMPPWGPNTLVDPPVPPPSTWWFWVNGGWVQFKDLPATGPTPMFEGPAVLAEVSATWIPELRRWHTIYQGDGVSVRTARKPWGKWTNGTSVFHGEDPARAADNLDPGHRFVGLDPELREGSKTAAYAPYLVPAWTRYDASIRLLTLYYLVSTELPPYNVQLMSAQLQYPSA